MAVGQTAGVEATLAAAIRNGMTKLEAAVLLATGWQETKLTPTLIGDQGNSFGLFQQNVNGAAAGAKNPRAFLVPSNSANEAAVRFKTAGVKSGAGAVASQRPLESLRPKYRANVDATASAVLDGNHEINRLISSSPRAADLAAQLGIGSAGTVTAFRPKWSPQRDLVAKKAAELGLRKSSGDRSPSSNSAAGGATGSNHLTTNTGAWADDYVGSVAAMNALLAYAKTLPGNLDSMVHDAGSGLHAHIAGKASGSGSSGADGGSSGAELDTGVDGLVRTGVMPTDKELKDAALKVVVVLIGLALAAGLIFAGVNKLTSGSLSTMASAVPK
jgi:hypothetical protein